MQYAAVLNILPLLDETFSLYKWCEILKQKKSLPSQL